MLYITIIKCLVFLSLDRHRGSCVLVKLFTVKSINFLCSDSCIFSGVLRPRRRVHVGIMLNVRRSLANTNCGMGRSGVTVNSNNLAKGKFLGNARAGLGCIPRRSASFVFYAMNRRRNFIKSSVILLLFLTLVLQLVTISRQRPSTFKHMCKCSMIDVFLFRVFVGVNVMLKLAPIVNVPLPFFDCKNSSL